LMEDFPKRMDFKVDKYNLMGQCQREGIRQAVEAGTYDGISFGYADFIWSTGSLQNALTRFEEGYDAVFCPGLPVVEDEFKAELDTIGECWKNDSGVQKLNLPPRQLVKLTLDNLHDLAKVNFLSRDKTSTVCAYQMWDVAGEGVLMRWFHLHPVFLRLNLQAVTNLAEWEGSLDEHYIPMTIREPSRIYFCQDSDEVSFCSLMPDFKFNIEYNFGNSVPLAWWAERNTGFIHRQFFKIPFRFHHSQVTEDAWRMAEEKSIELVEQVNARLSMPDLTLKYEDPYAYKARLARKSKLLLRKSFYRMLERGWGGFVRLCEATDNRYIKFMVHNRLTGTIVQVAKRALGR